MGQLLYKKVSGYVEKQVDNELVIVPMVAAVAEMDKVFSLNEIGSIIYEFLSEPKSEDEILSKIINEFEVSETIAKEDIHHFLNQSIKAGVIHMI